jgi:hypothetical protein
MVQHPQPAELAQKSMENVPAKDVMTLILGQPFGTRQMSVKWEGLALSASDLSIFHM